MARTKTWDVSDAFWALVEPLLPTAEEMRDPNTTYKRKSGAGRKSKYSNRTYFSAMVYVLRTGIIWNALPREKFNGLSSSALHYRFQLWCKAGFFQRIWAAGLAEYDDLKGIDWRWQSADAVQIKAPLAQESVGANPTDRGKNGEQAECLGGRQWSPAVDRRQRGKQARLEEPAKGS